MNCQDIAWLLDDGDMDGLADAEQAAVDAHLASCVACADDWSAHRLLQARRIPAAPAGLKGRTWRVLDQAPPRSSAGRYGRPMLLGGLLLAAAAAAVLASRFGPGGGAGADAPGVFTDGGATTAESPPASVAATSPPLPARDPAAGTDTAAGGTAADSTVTRVVVLPVRHENPAGPAVVYAEAVHTVMVRELRLDPGIELIELTAGQVAAVDLSGVDVSRTMAAAEAVRRHHGGDGVIEIVSLRGFPFSSLLGLPDPWFWRVLVHYYDHPGSGGTVELSPPGDPGSPTDFDSQMEMVRRVLLRSFSLSYREQLFADALVTVTNPTASESERNQALMALRLSNRLLPGADVSAPIVAAIIDLGTRATNAGIRQQAWSLAGDHARPEFREPLTQALLFDPSDFVRRTAAIALQAYSSDPTVRAALELAASNDNAAVVRRQARAMLLEVEARQELVLDTLLDDKLPHAERIAPLTEQLWQISTPGFAAELRARADVLEALGEIATEAEDARSRLVAVRELGESANSEYLDLLIDRLRNDSDAGVRTAAAVALAEHYADVSAAQEALEAVRPE